MSGLASCGHNAGLRPGWWTVSGRGYRAVSLTPEKVGGASFLPRSGSLELYSSPEKIGKHQSNLHLLVRPILRRHQIDIEVAGKEVEEFAMRDRPVRGLGDGVAVGLVVAGDDAGGCPDRIQVLFARTDHGKLSAAAELVAPALHGGDESLRVHGQERLTVRRPRRDALLEMIELADRRHSAHTGGADILLVIVLCQALRGKSAASDPPEQQRPHGVGIFEGDEERKLAARRAAPENGRQRVEPREQFIEVVGPHFVFRALAPDGDIGKAAVSAVVEEHAITGIAHALGERLDEIERAAATGGKREPRAVRAEYLVVEIDAADAGNRHDGPPPRIG